MYEPNKEQDEREVNPLRREGQLSISGKRHLPTEEALKEKAMSAKSPSKYKKGGPI